MCSNLTSRKLFLCVYVENIFEVSSILALLITQMRAKYIFYINATIYKCYLLINAENHNVPIRWYFCCIIMDINNASSLLWMSGLLTKHIWCTVLRSRYALKASIRIKDWTNQSLMMISLDFYYAKIACIQEYYAW